MDFDPSGRLVGWARPNKSSQTISYSDGGISVSDDVGDQLTLTVDQQGQVMSLQANGVSIVYSYQVAGQLVKVSSVRGASSLTRLYQYEDGRNILLLTGITDERGVRYATWSYDDQKRALTSEHGVGVERVALAFNEDGSTTVINALGKKATYQFQLLQGVKRVVSIHGEASDNCPLSDSSFTYNFRGQIQTATDAKGLVTTYSYNDRGLEVSRTEASGTPLARTTTTEWDPSRFLKTKVVEPTRTTLYTYDAQGRPLSQQTTSN
jgi:YD repeat-containing protein